MVLLRKTLQTVTLVAATLLAACQFRPDESVDFGNLQGTSNLSFRVIGQHEVDLNEGIPTNCYLPDGTRVVDYIEHAEEENHETNDASDAQGGPTKAPKTTSTTAADTQTTHSCESLYRLLK